MAEGWAMWWASPDPLDQEGPEAALQRVAPGSVRKLPFVRKSSLSNAGPCILSPHPHGGAFTTPPPPAPPRIDEAAKAQRGQATFPRSPSSGWRSRNSLWASGTAATLCHLVPHSWQPLLFFTLPGVVAKAPPPHPRASHLFPILPSPRSHCS